MLDVHPPHKAIGNTSEFFLHLFTITIGLLIAVGIEGCVSRYEHHQLAAEARRTMTAEIKTNSERMSDALTAIDLEQKKAKDNMVGIQKIQVDPKGAPDDLNIDIGYSLVGLEDTAWKTAQATGALSYMPYAEAERFSNIYGAEEAFLKSQERLVEDESQFLGIIQQFHVGKGKLSVEAANTMAKQSGITQGHLINMKLAARYLQAEQNAFLQGKEPPHHLFEGLHD